MSTKTKGEISQEYAVNCHQKCDLVNSLNEQRKGERFCDAVLIADGQKFNAHKSVFNCPRVKNGYKIIENIQFNESNFHLLIIENKPSSQMMPCCINLSLS